MKHATRFLACAAAAAAWVVGGIAVAQSYPNKTVKFVVTYPGGGSSDVMARIIGQKLTDMWGQQCLVDLKPGAAGALTFGTSGAGSMSHLAGEMFKRIANVDIVAVNYKGGSQWITELMGNQISMVIADAAPAMANMKSGKIRALAVTSDKRSPFTPELPTLTEEGLKGFAAVNWWGILFPTGVPRPIIDKVNSDFVKVLAMQEVKDKLAVFGVEAVSSTPEQFGKFMDAKRAKWGKLILEANIKLE